MSPELRCAVPAPEVFHVSLGHVWWRPGPVLWDYTPDEWTPARLLDDLADLSRSRQGKSDEDRAARLAQKAGAALGDCGVVAPGQPPHWHWMRAERPDRWQATPSLEGLGPSPPGTPPDPAFGLDDPRVRKEPLTVWLDLAHLVNAMRRVVVAVRQGTEPRRDDMFRLWPPLRSRTTYRVQGVYRRDSLSGLDVETRTHDEIMAAEAEKHVAPNFRFDPDRDEWTPEATYGRVVSIVAKWLADLHVTTAVEMPDDPSGPAVAAVRLGSVAAKVGWALREELVREGTDTVRVCADCGLTWAPERQWDPKGRRKRPDRPEDRPRRPRTLCDACSAVERQKPKPKEANDGRSTG